MAEEVKEKGKCPMAMLAALELLHEECEGEEAGTFKFLVDGLIVYIPKEFIEKFESETGHKFGNPIVDKELREKAIESCMAAPWASRMVEKMVGIDAPEAVKEAVKRKFCERLIT